MTNDRLAAREELLSAAIVLEVPEHAAGHVRRIQSHYGYGQESLPVHVTIAGSNGLGGVELDRDLGAVLSIIDTVAHSTPPITAAFGPAMRFPDTDIFVLTLVDEGPVTRFHRVIAESGLPFGQCPFPFRPHCTLTSGRPLTDDETTDLFASQVDGEFVLDTLSLFSITPAQELLHRVLLT